MEYIIFNGNIVRNTTILTCNNRAFRYGDGLFESMRYSEGNIPLLSQHLIRLKRGMKTLSYDNCDCISEDKILSNVNDLIEKNDISGSARVRLSIFRKEGGLYAPDSNKFDFIIELSPLNQNDFKLEKKGLIIGISKKVQKPQHILSEIKTSNALLYVIASIEAKKNNWDDILLCNQQGAIAEASSSNLFLIKGKTIYTPPISDGAMDGIMRQQIALIVKESEYKLKVKSIHKEDLESADEVFLTNAVKGIMWVVGYENKRYFNKATKKLTTLLNNHFKKLNISKSD